MPKVPDQTPSGLQVVREHPPSTPTPPPATLHSIFDISNACPRQVFAHSPLDFQAVSRLLDEGWRGKTRPAWILGPVCIRRFKFQRFVDGLTFTASGMPRGRLLTHLEKSLRMPHRYRLAINQALPGLWARGRLRATISPTSTSPRQNRRTSECGNLAACGFPKVQNYYKWRCLPALNPSHQISVRK
jgi:hypothetical protein